MKIKKPPQLAAKGEPHKQFSKLGRSARHVSGFSVIPLTRVRLIGPGQRNARTKDVPGKEKFVPELDHLLSYNHSNLKLLLLSIKSQDPVFRDF